MRIHQKDYTKNFACKNYNEFDTAVQNNSINNINSLTIELRMNFKRGNEENMDSHKNSFVISFKPYEIVFIRKSNHNDPDMNEIENTIKDILNQFPIANSIFCSK